MTQLVSIVVPVYNAENYLQECLCSIDLQRYPNLEVIVIDDCSTDKSFDIISDWVDKTRLPTLVLRHLINLGECKTTAEGFSLAKGKYLIRMSCDDKYVDRDQIVCQVRDMEKYSLDWCYVSHMMLQEDDKWEVIQTSFVPFPWQPAAGVFSIFDNYLLRHRYYCYFVNIIRNPINVNSLMVSSNAYHKFTSWDQELRTACDALVTGDLILKGASGRAVKDTVGFWRIHKDQQTQTKETQGVYRKLRGIKFDKIRNGDYPLYVKMGFEIIRRIT